MEDGGLKVGDKVYAPEMIMYDDEYTGQGGTTAANRLVNQDKVEFIIGPIGSPSVLGLLNVTTPEKVVVLSDGFSPDILAADQEYNFRISLTTEEFAPPIVQWLKAEYPEAKTVGMIYPDDEIGQAIVPILEEAYRDIGFDVPVSIGYERGNQDFTSELTRMTAEGVDIFELNSNAPGEAGLLVQQAKQLGFQGIMIQSGGPGIEEIIQVAGEQADGFLSYDIYDPQDPRIKPFVNAYREKYGGEAINAYAPIMYNATNLLFEAIRRAKSVDDTEKVRDALRQLQGYETIFGKVRWTGEERYGIDHQLLMEFYISEVHGGDYSAIERLSA
jgi:branched-chain amino acid transport system substrate-binding protein